MRIELEDGWSQEALNLVVTVGNTSFRLNGCYKDHLPYELTEFANALERGEQFAPELGYEPAFNVGFVSRNYRASLFKPRFRSRWLWWMGSTKVQSELEPVETAVSYLREFADRLSGS